MTAIIFGAAGQDGIYLTQLLLAKQCKVIAVNRSADGEPPVINSFEKICQLVKDNKPQYIFHLAANSTTNHNAWQQNHETISTGSMNILEAVKQYSPATKIFLSGSGLQFKNTGLPIKETDDFDASSIYAVSRIHTVYAARYYRSMGIKVYVGYFFNHDSPYRTERHINKKISEIAKRIASGSKEKLQIGDLTVKKEFGFAGDIVKAIITLVEQDAVYEAVIGTGVAHTIEEWIAVCFGHFGLEWQKYTESLAGFTSEYRILVSNPSTIFSIGWKPEATIQSLAKIMLT